jgi:hypothetical protein
VSIGNGLSAAEEALGVACLSDPVCAAILIGGSVIYLGIEYGPQILQMAKGGAQNVADTGIEEEAQELVRQGKAKTMCGALDQLLAGAQGDPQRAKRIRKTQKAYDCRRHG